MQLRKLLLTFALIVTPVITLASQSTAVNCHAVISNNSTKPWTVRFQTVRGNVYFPGAACEQNGPCVIQPQSILNIEYTYTTHLALGAVYFKDMNGNQRTYGYLAEHTGDCPKIEAADHTDGINLNDPYLGNYAINVDTF